MDHRRDRPRRRRPARDGVALTAPSDLAVVGLGPAGRALVHRAARAGLDVVAVDPHPGRPWGPTYAAWADELPAWLDATAIRSTVERPEVFATRRRSIERTYVVLDNMALHRSLDPGAARIVQGRVVEVTPHTALLRDGTLLRARQVIDARGLPSDPTLPEQTAFGIVVPTAVAGPGLDGADGWFMDWRRDNGTAKDDPPSFLYAVPLGDEAVLFEETCLVGRPGLGFEELRRRLDARLRSRGVDVPANLTVERARFPVQAPRASSQVPAFGARAGLIHPGTGYSVATAFSCVDAVVDALAVGRDPRAVLWPARARAVRALRETGLHALLDLDPRSATDFFDAFFAMTPARQRAYLSGRTDAVGTAAAMWRVFVGAPAPVRRTLVQAVLSRHRPAR